MNEDTRLLLKECDAGTKMAVDTIDQVLPSIHSSDFKNGLKKYRDAHVSSGDKLHALLSDGDEAAGDIGIMAKASARLMTGFRLMLDDSDKKIASMLTDGCNMGIKSIEKYLNQYTKASKEARKTAENIVRLEENMMEDLRPYL